METVTIHVLWGRIEGNPYPQFVAAFTDGEVECWPEMYERRRAEAEQFAREFGDEFDVWVEFWTTVVTLQRPLLPPLPEALDLRSGDGDEGGS